MRRKIIFLAVWMAALVAIAGFNFGNFNLAGALQNTGKMLHGASGIGLREEVTIGNSVAVEIVARYGGVLRDEAAMRRINLVGKSLALFCDRPELNYRFGILNSPTVNAFSAPGGDIFITKGLYDLIQNDDQLAGVLAHEITHVSKRHALKIIERGEFFQGVSGLAQQAGDSSGKLDLAKYSQSVNQVTTTLFEKGFDPQTEFEADRGGAQLAATAGYAPDGLEQCLKILQQHQSGAVSFFPTHPPLKERIEKLDTLQTASR